MSLPRANAATTIVVWALTEAGRLTAHPITGRAPADDRGAKVLDDTFTYRRIADGDWTLEQPKTTAKPATASPAAPAVKAPPAPSKDA